MLIITGTTTAPEYIIITAGDEGKGEPEVSSVLARQLMGHRWAFVFP